MPQALGKIIILLLSIISIVSISCHRNRSNIKDSDTNSIEDTIMALIEKGERCANERNYSQANMYANKALIIIDNTRKVKQDLYKIVPYNIKANYYLDYSYDSSIYYANKAIKLSKEYGNIKEQAIALNVIGNAYHLAGENFLALKTWEKGFKIAKEYNLEEEEAKLLFNMGVIFKIWGDYTKAVKYYQSALKTYEGLNDSILIAKILNNIGNIYFSYEIDYHKALSYYLKSLNIYMQYKDSIIIADICSNIGIAFLEMKQNEKSLEYFTRSYNIYKLVGNNSGIAFSYNQFGEIQLMLGEFDKALKYFIKAQNIYKDIGEKGNYLYSYAQIAGVYKAMNEFDIALELHIEYLKNVLKQGFKSEILRQYKEISKIYESLGDFKKAIEYYKKYSELKDSLINEKNLNQIAKLETIYETEKKEKAIIQLEKEKITQTVEIKRQKFHKLLLFNITIMFFLLTTTILVIYQQNRKSNVILASKKHEIEEKNILLKESIIEKETLLKEVHHRVKNNLQIISSILNLQTRYISDTKIYDQVLEGKNRVKSMALIHETLFSFNNLSSVNFKPYLTKLLKYITNTYKINGREIQNNIYVEDISFDIDVAIPIGLIINELVSNAYKYAFTYQKKGKINVILRKIENEKYLIRVSDNGIGLAKDINNISTLGLRLVKKLVYQLDGELIIKRTNGTEFSIIFGTKKLISNNV